MNTFLLVAAILSLVLGAGFFGRYLYLNYKSKQEKSLVVIGLGILAFWFFGGSTLVVVALLLFALLFLKGC